MYGEITVWIDGVEYVDVLQVASRLFYDQRTVWYWIERKQVGTTLYEGRRLVSIADCLALEKKKQQAKTKPKGLAGVRKVIRL